jgi:hypothetical protein
VEDLRIDDRPLDEPVVYVNPGTHVLEGRASGRLLRRAEVLEAGSVRSTALVEEPPPAPLAPLPKKASGPRSPGVMTPKPAPTGPWLPALTIGGGAAVTLAMTGATAWSGLDTLAARREFDANPTQDRLDAGRDKQLRTNALLGASVGMGALTAVAAVWTFGKWGGGPPQVALALSVRGGPVMATLGGSF